MSWASLGSASASYPRMWNKSRHRQTIQPLVIRAWQLIPHQRCVIEVMILISEIYASSLGQDMVVRDGKAVIRLIIGHLSEQRVGLQSSQRFQEEGLSSLKSTWDDTGAWFLPFISRFEMDAWGLGLLASCGPWSFSSLGACAVTSSLSSLQSSAQSSPANSTVSSISSPTVSSVSRSTMSPCPAPSSRHYTSQMSKTLPKPSVTLHFSIFH